MMIAGGSRGVDVSGSLVHACAGRALGLLMLYSLAAGAGAAARPTGGDDQRLIERAAAERSNPQEVTARELPADSRGAGERSRGDDVQTLRSEAALAVARLKNQLARQALLRNELEEAARQAHDVLDLLRVAAPSEEAGALELQAEGILSKAARAGAARGGADRAKKPVPARTRVASEVAEPGAAGGSPADVNGVGSAAEDQRRWDSERERARTRRSELRNYQRRLEDAVRLDEDWQILTADEDRLVGDGWIQYPADWPELSQSRAGFRGGLIHRGPTHVDAEGREWFAGVYDLGDLAYVPPDDDLQYLDPALTLRNTLDRDALRNHSMIFRGWPEDLAAGLPLLRFFGGVGDFRGYHSMERQQEVVRMIRAQLRESAADQAPARVEWIGR